MVKPTSGTQQANFIVTLSGASSLVTTVDFATSDIMAVAGTNYMATQGVLTLTPGQTTAIIPVTILGNSTPTGTLTFAVTSRVPWGGLISGSPQAIGTIQDVNPVVGISVANTVVTVDGPNNSQVDFTVTLFPAMSSEVVTVQYATVDGTAVAGKDYLAAQGVLTFEPGQFDRGRRSDHAFGALTPEPTKQFSLMLSNANPSGTPISIAQGTATILNAVVVPVVSIDSVQVNRPASGTTPAIFTVSLSEQADRGSRERELCNGQRNRRLRNRLPVRNRYADFRPRSDHGPDRGAGHRQYAL